MRRYIAILLLVLPSVCLAAEYPPIEFHTDGIIQNGDAFSYVQVFDNAKVEMTGGLIDIGGLWLNNSSVFSAYGGTISSPYIVVLDNAILNLHYLHLSENHRFSATGILATINVYGKNFEYVQSSGNWLLNGNWANNEEFSLLLRGPDTRDYVVLHEIPEPGTIVLLIFGALGLARKNR